ncbi:MAG TPA: pantoate--beta-alanine ligase [Xanthobacteraceae bacterium]|jgi:pantoate--beta-alanine ligase|nr:pantoate--beta-alanine ligase [Xanthobacteraceae bacterium]
MNHKKSKRYPRVIRTLPSLRRAVAEFRARRATIALVPTMGALHAGHFALVRIAQRRAKRVIVSIFVNPTQFAPSEDLGSYPRTFAADLAALGELKADLVWAPPVETMYPAGFATRVVPEGAAKAGLEDAFRPHFFAGVATVVAKLLIQCEPDIAMFGEKDYQQLKVVGRLTRDLALKTRIVGAPIVREKDGLALSSRNRYLSTDERAAAPALYRVLKQCAGRIAAGAPLTAVLDDGRAAIREAGFALDYLEARNAETLAPLSTPIAEPIRLLMAARIGATRLIDNVAV